MNRMKVTTSNDDFEFSHGRAPRGRGTWAFQAFALDGCGSTTDLNNGRPIFVNDVFTVARKEAIRQAKLLAKEIGRAVEVHVVTLG